MKKVLTLVAVAAVFVGCCNCLKSVERTRMPITGETGWRLVQMNGQAFEAPEGSFELVFGEDGRVAGRGSCNRISGPYTNDNDKGSMTFGAMVSTRMMCPDQSSEDRFLKLLSEIDAYTVDGNMLMLLTKGELKLMFERAEAEKDK